MSSSDQICKQRGETLKRRTNLEATEQRQRSAAPAYFLEEPGNGRNRLIKTTLLVIPEPANRIWKTSQPWTGTCRDPFPQISSGLLYDTPEQLEKLPITGHIPGIGSWPEKTIAMALPEHTLRWIG